MVERKLVNDNGEAEQFYRSLPVPSSVGRRFGHVLRLPLGGLVHVLASRFPFLVLCWATESFLFELVGLSLCLIGFCSFL
jgi:hypothetical protein